MRTAPILALLLFVTPALAACDDGCPPPDCTSPLQVTGSFPTEYELVVVIRRHADAGPEHFTATCPAAPRAGGVTCDSRGFTVSLAPGPTPESIFSVSVLINAEGPFSLAPAKRTSMPATSGTQCSEDSCATYATKL